MRLASKANPGTSSAGAASSRESSRSAADWLVTGAGASTISSWDRFVGLSDKGGSRTERASGRIAVDDEVGEAGVDGADEDGKQGVLAGGADQEGLGGGEEERWMDSEDEERRFGTVNEEKERRENEEE
jgi:hypothetical protein